MKVNVSKVTQRYNMLKGITWEEKKMKKKWNRQNNGKNNGKNSGKKDEKGWKRMKKHV